MRCTFLRRFKVAAVTGVVIALLPLICLWVLLAPDEALAATGDRACYTIVANSGNSGVAEVFGGTYWAVGIAGAPPDNDLTVYAANFAATYGSGPGFTLSSLGPHVIFTATDNSATSTAASGDDFSPLHTGDYPNSPDGHERPFRSPSTFDTDCGDVTPPPPPPPAPPSLTVACQRSDIESATDPGAIATWCLTNTTEKVLFDLDWGLVLAFLGAVGAAFYHLFRHRAKM